VVCFSGSRSGASRRLTELNRMGYTASRTFPGNSRSKAPRDATLLVFRRRSVRAAFADHLPEGQRRGGGLGIAQAVFVFPERESQTLSHEVFSQSPKLKSVRSFFGACCCRRFAKN
jgi:hypothetical protein